ncbi:MAG: glycosyltransferase [Chloroflexota bacterium]
MMIANGTRGDVQPAIALGKALKAARFQVEILASKNFAEWIESHGLTAVPSSLNIPEIMASEGGKQWVEEGHKPLVQMRVMKKLLDKFGHAFAQEAWRACEGADAIISSFTSDVYALTIAEKLNVPIFSVALQPPLIATKNGRSLPNAPLPNRNSIINHWFSKLIIEPFPWRIYGEITNDLRKQLGLPPQTNAQNIVARQQMPVLMAYSSHVVPRPYEFPSNYHDTGFWFLEDTPNWEPPFKLLEFLDNGPPPIYVGFGSMTNRDPGFTTQLIVEAIERLGRRAIIISGWSEVGKVPLPNSMLTLPNAPHNWLFPQLAAVVHHGGAGTTAAGLRAGVPSIIIPHMVDQPFWAQRVHAIGAGPKPIAKQKLTAVSLAEAITEATSNSNIHNSAIAISQRIKAENGLAKAVAVIKAKI